MDSALPIIFVHTEMQVRTGCLFALVHHLVLFVVEGRNITTGSNNFCIRWLSFRNARLEERKASAHSEYYYLALSPASDFDAPVAFAPGIALLTRSRCAPASLPGRPSLRKTAVIWRTI